MSGIYSGGEYLSRNPAWHSEDAAWKAKQILKILTRNDVDSGDIADFGCGTGDVLRSLALDLPSALLTGYEVSPDAAAFWPLQNNLNLNLHLVPDMNAAGSHQLGLSLDVLEHIDDYPRYLHAIGVRASRYIFHIPLELSVSTIITRRFLHARNEVGHLHFFTLETALLALTDCGYVIEDWHFTPAFEDKPGNTKLERFARLPRRMFFAISEEWMQRLVGGCSLMVLAKYRP